MKTVKMKVIEERIFLIRGLRVMVDRDLAELYGVPTKVLNQAVKRNHKRFPVGFMFRLNSKELKQLVTNCDRFKMLKHSSVFPLVFTEHGAVMLASVLNSPRAIQLSLLVVKAFIRYKNEFSIYKELLYQLTKLTGKVKNHDFLIKEIIKTIHSLMTPKESSKRVIVGFAKH